MAPTNFDDAAWIRRLGVALEDVAANATPQYSPHPPELMGILPNRDVGIDSSPRVSFPCSMGETRCDCLEAVQ